MKNLSGRVVAISGASSGIGEATARYLTNLGACVVVGARRIERLEQLVAELRSLGGRITAQRLDVCNLESFEAFVAATESAYGRIDVLVNNAGVMPLSNLSALRI
ncbi:MAG: SDR family oxidoreductase, partial [Casimicrobium sp.]